MNRTPETNETKSAECSLGGLIAITAIAFGALILPHIAARSLLASWLAVGAIAALMALAASTLPARWTEQD